MIDISGWNSAFKKSAAGSFRACAAAGIDHAYIKASEGRSHTFDRFLELAVAGCEQGLQVGAYHFARPDVRLGDAESEGDAFLKVIQGVPLQLAPVLDIETAKDWLGDTKGLIDWCIDWCQHVYKSTHRKPIIYTGPGFWASSLGRTTVLQDLRLWVAAYPKALPSSDSKPPTLAGWQPVAWQYTGQGRVQGLDGVVDLSYVYGDMT